MRRQFFFWKFALIIIAMTVLNLRSSLSSTSPFRSLDKELLMARTGHQGDRKVAHIKDGSLLTAENTGGQPTVTTKDTMLQKKEDRDRGITVPLSTTKAPDNGPRNHEEKSMNMTALASQSYGTTDVDEFKRLHHEYLLGRQKELKSSHLSTQAREKDSNGNSISSYGYVRGNGFIAGFRNQMMALTMLAMRANYDGHKQLILDHLVLKDTYGTNKFEPFEFYFDVEHWNQYSYNKERLRGNGVPVKEILEPERFPNWLPRLVFYDPSIHDELDPSTKLYKTKEIASNATRPYGFQQATTTLFGNYATYGKGKGRFVPRLNIRKSQEKVPMRNPADILLLQDALRPNPALQAVVDRSKEHLREMGQRGTSGSSTFRYMALHARVEPDMQKHPPCRDKKVLKLQEIVDMMESKWPDPPVDAVFLPINRQYLEKEGILPENFKNDTSSSEEINWIAVENLQLLNHLSSRSIDNDGKAVGGLWNGRVPVVEFGSEALRGSVYEHRPSLSGAILNYFLALDADIFIGTEVSSYSIDILGSRFYRGLSSEAIHGREKTSTKYNYKYLPGGLEEWVRDDMIVPPNFGC